MGTKGPSPLSAAALDVLAKEGRSRSVDEDHSSLEDLADLEAEVGFVLPADVRWVMAEVPGVRLRPRVYSYHDRNCKILLHGADVLSASDAQYWLETLLEMWTEGVSEELAEWARHLVPIAELEGGHEALCLDFQFDPVAPPVIEVDDANFEAPDSAIDFVAASFEDLLLLPVWVEGDYSFVDEPADQDATALAWTAARDARRSGLPWSHQD